MQLGSPGKSLLPAYPSFPPFRLTFLLSFCVSLCSSSLLINFFLCPSSFVIPSLLLALQHSFHYHYHMYFRFLFFSLSLPSRIIFLLLPFYVCLLPVYFLIIFFVSVCQCFLHYLLAGFGSLHSIFLFYLHSGFLLSASITMLP